MTAFEFAVTYAVCWWLVLFMVLPHQAQPSEKPELGHAPSAPEKPQLRKKFRWATLIAFIPAIALYFIVENAHAEDSMYHAGSAGSDTPSKNTYHAGGNGKCKPLAAYHTPDGVNATDGTDANGKKIAPATLGGDKTILGDRDHYDIPIEIPSAKYLNQNGHTRNFDASQSFIGVGKLQVGTDGKTSLNGKPIDQQDVYPEGCDHEIDSH